MGAAMQREELNRYLDGLLEVSRFHDYCPNGLQVEGREDVRRIATGVTASLELIQAARAQGADAILVHHGYFWKGDDPCLTGTRRARVALLLAQELNLFAYHLPWMRAGCLTPGARLGLVETALRRPSRPGGAAAAGRSRCRRSAGRPLVIGDGAVRKLPGARAQRGFFEKRSGPGCLEISSSASGAESVAFIAQAITPLKYAYRLWASICARRVGIALSTSQSGMNRAGRVCFCHSFQCLAIEL
jgi:hypothetical protein